ncbi:hypothetical protein [Dysgonomonas sp. Marseille-P4361]|uniref:hypothetical protein n=1 Tax=Dysgonomonas sp. Marseille-P4361 TaxID=2161820 RepID=UPI000D550E5C|nr:hypothetical protein [Dysgonomonas sp. Marseille-P4361]
MNRDQIIKEYMSSYNAIVAKYKENKILALVEDINLAISRSDMKVMNEIHERISEWNDEVSMLQMRRDALMAKDKSYRLPSVVEFMIVYDHINKEWRFNTEAY